MATKVSVRIFNFFSGAIGLHFFYRGKSGLSMVIFISFNGNHKNNPLLLLNITDTIIRHNLPGYPIQIQQELKQVVVVKVHESLAYTSSGVS